MLPCPSCARHVLGEERACPFCSSPLQSTPAKRVHAAVIVIAVGAVLSACGPAESDSGDMADASSSSSGGVSTTASGTTASGTTDPRPGGTTTDPAATTSGGTSIGDTTTGGDSTTLDDDTLDSCGGFYGGCPTDVGPSYECDVFMQDCGDNEKCMPWANDGGEIWNASRCTLVDQAPVASGEPCTVEGSGVSGIDTCVLGAMCFYVDPETNEGTCVEMCSNSEEAPICLEGTCVVQFDGALPLCFETCDPKVATCSDDQACEPVSDETLDTDVCTPA